MRSIRSTLIGGRPRSRGGVMRLNQGRDCSPGNDHFHLTQEALSPRGFMVALEAEAGEAFSPHGGGTYHLKGRCETETQNQ